MNTQGNIQEIEAREKATEWLRKFHRHDRSVSYPSAVGCSICFLLVQLKDGEEKLAALEEQTNQLDDFGEALKHGSTEERLAGEKVIAFVVAFNRILQGGE